MPLPFSNKLRRIAPYVPGEQPKSLSVIKLNANENPYPPSPAVSAAIAEFDYASLAVYPDANGTVLKQALAEKFSVKTEQVFLGNGSDDVLALCFQSFFCSEKPILFPDVTYSFYPVWCDLFRIPYETPALREDFTLDLAPYSRDNGGVIVPNPNAPTGIALTPTQIETLLKTNANSIVIIDEAYVDFGADSAISLLPKYENLVVVQTMSKSRSLAGQRIGYAIASPELISVLEAVKNSYNSYTMDMLSIAIGTAAVQDETYFADTCARIIKTRERAAAALKALGFQVLPSQANFLFARHNKKTAPQIFDTLRQENIFVRYFSAPRTREFLRITIGTDAQIDALLAALQRIL